MSTKSSKAYLQNLVIKGKLDKAIPLLIDCTNCTPNNRHYSHTALLLSSQYHNIRRQFNHNMVDNKEYQLVINRISSAILDTIDDLEDCPNGSLQFEEEADEPETVTDKIKVFISFSHQDRPVVLKVKQRLEEAGLETMIDMENLYVGNSILNYIKEGIRDTDYTVSIVSNHSLLSSWVASETALTMMHEEVREKNKFFACYIDDDFFKPSYVIRMVRKIDQDIKEREEVRNEMQAEKIDASHLSLEITRLHELRNNASKILNRLINSLSLDIREPLFEENMQKLIRAIQAER
jgi:hypothetical protein